MMGASTDGTCSYCGCRLRIARAASGHPLAVLADVKADTALIAREVALRRLVEKARNLRHQRNSLLDEQSALQEIQSKLTAEYQDQLDQYRARVPRTVAVLVDTAATTAAIVLMLLGVICLMAGGGAGIVLGLVFMLAAIAVARVTIRRRRNRLRKRLKYSGLADEYEPHLNQVPEETLRLAEQVSGLSEEISRAEQRMGTIKSQMDSLTEELWRTTWNGR